MSSTQLVIFKLEGEEYGVDITTVNGINKATDFEIVKVPNSPEMLEGIINLRGKVNPIFNLRKKFNFVNKPIDENSKIVIVYIGDATVGFIVDEVTEILRLEEENIEVAPKAITGIDRKYITGVGKVDKRMIILLDLNRVLTEEEHETIKDVVN
jgi:purine-binding chemotaxis protein CheW